MKDIHDHLARQDALLAEQAKLTTDLAGYRSDYQRQLDAGDTSEKAIRAITALQTTINVSEARLKQLARELTGLDAVLRNAVAHHRRALLVKIGELSKRRREQLEKLLTERCGCTPKDAGFIVADIIRRHQPPVFKSLAKLIGGIENLAPSPSQTGTPRQLAEQLLRAAETARADEALTALK